MAWPDSRGAREGRQLKLDGRKAVAKTREIARTRLNTPSPNTRKSQAQIQHKFKLKELDNREKGKEQKSAFGTYSSLRRLLTSAELSAATGRGREPLRPEGGTSETPGCVQPHSLLRESVTGGELHKHWPSSQASGLFQNAIASQAFAFFTGSGPFPKRDSFTGIRLLHRLWAFSETR